MSLLVLELIPNYVLQLHFTLTFNSSKYYSDLELGAKCLVDGWRIEVKVLMINDILKCASFFGRQTRYVYNKSY